MSHHIVCQGRDGKGSATVHFLYGVHCFYHVLHQLEALGLEQQCNDLHNSQLGLQMAYMNLLHWDLSLHNEMFI